MGLSYETVIHLDRSYEVGAKLYAIEFLGIVWSSWTGPRSFFPAFYRETQQDFFGKRGKSWHVSVVIHQDSDEELKMQSYVHVFDQVKQDWQAVASVIENCLHQIKSDLPDVNEVFLRSDNTGCYKCACLLTYLPQIVKNTGVLLKRYDFSEAQDGKDVCDRKIGPLRQRIWRFVREGHDVDSASAMKRALDQDGGVKGIYTATVELQPVDVKPPKWPGIQSLMNFCYNCEDGTVTSWKSYGIGAGRLRRCDSEFLLPHLEMLQNFIVPKQPEGDLSRKKAKTDTRPTSIILPSFNIACPEPGCSFTSATYEQLEQHTVTGQHKISSHDFITLKWQNRLETVSRGLQSARKPVTSEELLTLAPAQGWAMRSSKRVRQHSQAVKQFLQGLFEEGQQTGRKADPAAVSQDLKTARNAEGKKTFNPDDWLTPHQIANFFSRLSSHAKKTPAITEEDQDEDTVAVLNMHERALVKDAFFDEG